MENRKQKIRFVKALLFEFVVLTFEENEFSCLLEGQTTG